jgi:acetyl esterase/lipase
VGCIAVCADIDLERPHWHSIHNTSRPFVYYGYIGMIVAFCTYYWWYAGKSAQPLFQLLAYPMLDDRPAFIADPDPKHRRVMDQAMNRFGWESYLRGAEPGDVVPARAKDFRGLPPAWIGVGTHDLLFKGSLAYAERLKESGVPCAVEVVPGAFHGFDLLAPKLGVSQRFFESQCAALSGALESESQ